MKRALFVLLVLLVSIPAAAQESGQTGLAVGSPGSIGIIWHASDAIAIRPDFSFSHTHSESGTPSGSKSDSWGVGFGASALFYTGKIRDNVRTYVTPRFAYARTNVDSSASNVTLSARSHLNTYQYSGSFGIQFTPTRRFSVYGETGIQYATGESVFTTSGSGISSTGKSTNSTFGSRSGIGVVLYFD